MSAKNSVKISVVICTYNRADKLSKCLDAINNQSLRKGSYEVIVVNDGSFDNTSLVLEKYKFKVLTNTPNAGLAKSRNIGASNATADIIAFTDDDCIPDYRWLENILDVFNDPKVDAVGGKIIPYKTDTVLLKYYDEYNPLAHLPFTFDETSSFINAVVRYLHRSFNLKRLPEMQIPLYMIVGANMAMRSRVFSSINGFDPAIRFGGEEEDFWKRLHEHLSNPVLLYQPTAIVQHDYESNLRDALRRNVSYGKGSARNFVKYNGNRIPVLYPFPFILMLVLMMGFVYPILFIVIFLLPMILYIGWLKRSIKIRKISLLFFCYIQLLLESAHDYGFVLAIPEKYLSSLRTQNE